MIRWLRSIPPYGYVYATAAAVLVLALGLIWSPIASTLGMGLYVIATRVALRAFEGEA